MRTGRVRSPRNQGRVDPAAQKAALDKALGQLDLKEEQKEKIDGLQAAYDKKVKADQEKNKEKQEAFQKEMAAAREAGDRAKTRELMQQRRETMVAAAEEFKKHLTWMDSTALESSPSENLWILFRLRTILLMSCWLHLVLDLQKKKLLSLTR